MDMKYSYIHSATREDETGKGHYIKSKKLANMKYSGPGTWFAIHLMSFHARTTLEKLSFIRFMELVCENIKCNQCGEHCSEYLSKFPIYNYVDWLDPMSGEHLGMFRWTWEFHNAVNRRLDKSTVSWEEALKVYADKSEGRCMRKDPAKE